MTNEKQEKKEKKEKKKNEVTRRGFIKQAGVVSAGLTTALKGRAETQPSGIPGPRASRKVKMGVVGGGFGSTFFWHMHPDSEVVAVADLREDRRKRLVEVYSPKRVYVRFSELIKDPEVEAVHINTYAPDEARQSIEAMRAGKHAIAAVGAVMTLQECEDLITAVRETGKHFMLAETSHFRPGVMYAYEMARRNEFGTIFNTHGEYYHDKNELHPGYPMMYELDAEGRPTWRYGFPPMKYNQHATSPIWSIIGERLTEVSALGWEFDHPHYRENQYNNPFPNSIGLFKTERGNSCRLAFFFYGAVPYGERVEIYGTERSFIMGETLDEDHQGIPARIVTPTDVAAWEQKDYQYLLPPEIRVPSGHGGSHTHICNEFIRAILAERVPACNAWATVEFTAPGIVGHQSAIRGGDWLKIPAFEPPPPGAPRHYLDTFDESEKP